MAVQLRRKPLFFEGLNETFYILFLDLTVVSCYTGAVRLHPSGARGVGVQTRWRHHRDRQVGPALVDRRARKPARTLSSYIRHTIPYVLNIIVQLCAQISHLCRTVCGVQLNLWGHICITVHFCCTYYPYKIHMNTD